MYRLIIRPILFLLDPEKVHHISFSSIKFLSQIGLSGLFKSIFLIEDKRLERELFGLKFKNPVGLAAGFDKNAVLYNELSNFGFGFVEIGTLTPKPQDGNPKKRLFRLKADKAIINRMGFNNNGVFDAVEKLKKEHKVLIGGNIGKNKITPNNEAIKDYLICFDALFDHVDYFVVNVSSPNTPGLRELQDKEPLMALLNELQLENSKLCKQKETIRKPILLKIAPDLTESQLLDIIEIVDKTKIDGVIATNTTISRDNLKSHAPLVKEAGGLSGAPLKNRSTEVIRFLAQKSNKSFPIIGVGGIHSAEDAIEKLEAGADLIQLWTGFVYEGPGLVKKINKSILEKLNA
ncbi:quinone-dependent dihydroorotate dehydrogenase [Maribacter hydrothermalis]|uniref:Dihydroorotate dehydrogenase (quinone) n=1 Tax=Maribacter hydrothermalis TaxID=1836467 RepID=A0A1B7Z1M2_9FLAO|nr:quinone-dependent dihydroorotate dehydrogenase [Maribacter hydrothermalis]APQ18237.1 dihydroorotate dehydrogenase (quinone) [Maribacter hydrothermalis]OBR36584.1 dihydroorotate dehydrogenase (quinone) [Maribacter hydrothermalis]